MTGPFDQSTILITGASAGLGVEFARQLAPRAKAIALLARRVDRLEALKQELKAKHPSLQVMVYPCDLTQQNQIQERLAQIRQNFGEIDVLVNNAGMGDFAFYEEASWPKTQQMLELNITAPALLVREILGPMLRNRRGAILNVSSLAGLHFFPALSAYVGTKHFITGFTESLRAEVAGTGVVISQLCPGPVHTEFEQVAAGELGTPAAIPAWLELSAEACVRHAIRGWERGRATIVPGFLHRFVSGFAFALPKPLRRFLMGRFARLIRRRGLAAKQTA